MKFLFGILLAVFLADIAAAAELKKLSFEQVYEQKGEKLFKELPDIREWADDSHYYQVIKKKFYKVNAQTGKQILVIDAEKYKDLADKGFNILEADTNTSDYTRFVFKKDNDLYLFFKRTDKLIKFTATEGEEKNPTFSPDGSKVAYTLDGNLFVYCIPHNKILQLTKDGSAAILNGYASWIYYEEILGRNSRYKAFWWSPDNNKILYYRFDQSKVPNFYITRAQGIYGDLEKMYYPKPGFPNPTVKLGIAELKTQTTQWIRFSDPKDHYLINPRWNNQGDKIYFQWLNRDQDHIRVLSYDLAGKKIASIYQESQPSWVDFYEAGDLTILTGGGLILRSSKSGWFHLYHISMSGKSRQITAGDWSVENIDLVDQKNKKIYFSASRADSTRSEFFRVNFSGRGLVKLTPEKGSHSIDISPGGSYFIDSYSSIHFPSRMVLRNSSGKIIRKLGDKYSPVLEKYGLASRELFRIKTSDGFLLPASWFLPANFDKNKKYPVVFKVYGGPGSSSVSDSFGRRSLNNYYLAQQGIIVFSVDHRGSGHFGKKGMDLMYRSLGRWEMNDYIEAVKYLRELSFVDETRIGITGGSYGGYVSALALTFGADYFQYGIADASVIDWQLYDSVYTERYMDTPKDNPKGYKQGSVLTYIDNLKNQRLLILHGEMDDNVHMQNTIQFLDKAQDAGKLVELMIFPNARHGIRNEKKKTTNYKFMLKFWQRKFFNRE